MAERLKRSCRAERGAVLILTAICMLVIMGAVGLAIDVEGWYQNERRAQSSADAAALAGVQDLPSNPTTAVTDAQSYVTKNFPGATSVVTTPYNSDTSQIHVTVSATAPVWFTKLFGLSPVAVSASATAKKAAGTTPSAAFSSDANCSNQGLTINGGPTSTIVGSTHTAGSFFQNGNSSTFGPTTYGGPLTPSCFTDNGDKKNTYAGSSLPVRDTTSYGWPNDFIASPPTCTVTAASFTFSGPSATPAGVYCATGLITINSGANGTNVTFKADSFNFPSAFDFTPPANTGLLFYATGTQPVNVTVNGNNIHGGTIFAPNTTITINGTANTTTHGSVEGKDVIINENTNWTFIGAGASITAGTGGALTG